jgi:hypothetical protein
LDALAFELAKELVLIGAERRPRVGLLARMTRARALRASNGIEGINVSAEDALAAVDGEDLADADRPRFSNYSSSVSSLHAALRRGL